MRGPDRRPQHGGRRLPPIHPLLRQRQEPDPVPAPAPAPAADEAPEAAPRGPRLDGEGRPYITLAQFLKRQDLAATGGEAKHLARSGTVQVNGQAEDRPGRKLHQGDTVTVAGRTLAVDQV
jgi:ribosome-associated protein